MAKPSSKPRSTSQLVATKPACAPLLAMYRTAEASRPKTWTEGEDAFVRAMEAVDANVANGVADIGELQNGKGDFLNDLLALLLEGCAGVQLYSRGGVPGLVFASHNLDTTYPNTGVVKFPPEGKAGGRPRPRAPPHPGPPRPPRLGAGRQPDDVAARSSAKGVPLHCRPGRRQDRSRRDGRLRSHGGSGRRWRRALLLRPHQGGRPTGLSAVRRPARYQHGPRALRRPPGLARGSAR